MSPPVQTRRLAAVLFADIVGYSRITSEDEHAAMELIRVLQATSHACALECGGKVIKFIGDAAMVEFSSTDSAVKCAISIQAEFTSRAMETGRPALLRVGVHVGDVNSSPDGDIHGEGVNIAARIQTEAQPGQVLVSEDVWRQLRSRRDLRFTAAGERELKGIPMRVGVFSAGNALGPDDPLVIAVAPTGAALPPPAVGRYPGMRRVMLGGALVLVLALAASAYLSRPGAAPEAPPAAEPAARTIVVLPFANLSSDSSDAYFSDGITEDILTRVAQIQDLKVISRTSSMRYRGSPKSLGEIAQELHVAYVLEGTVRRRGNRVRITAQLIDARTDAHLWADTYDRDSEAVFEIQSDIAERIAAALRLRLAEGGPRDADPATVAAYTLLLRARERLRDAETDPAQAAVAIGLLRQAVDSKPGYAPAYAALSEAYVLRGGGAPVDTAETMARRALQLDSTLADAHTAMARVSLARGDTAGAEAGARRALAADPDHAPAIDLLKWIRAVGGGEKVPK